MVGEGVDVFEIQDRVIEDIFSVRDQQAIEGAPKILADEQQLVGTVLQAQRNNPALDSEEVRAALEALREPLPRAYLSDLREAHEDCQRDGDVTALLAAVQALGTAAGEQEQEDIPIQQVTEALFD